MRERDGFPAGVPSWIDTNQPDPERASAFYADLFGWRFTDRTPAGLNGRYLVATLGGKDAAAVGSEPAPAPPTPTWTTYIAVDSADATVGKIRDAGGTVISDPVDMTEAGRIAICADPAGAAFGLWQAGSMKGAEVVNVPGAWNWSDLKTNDIAGAKRFYSAVFGWEADEVDMGGLSGIMLRLPGYADFLEQFDPDLRKRHAEFGAPRGFSECIGWMLPLEAKDASAHWSVTFTVADADAIAAKAKELGGTVDVEPIDIGPVRTSTLRDPQGAQFTVSAFNPG